MLKEFYESFSQSRNFLNNRFQKEGAEDAERVL